MLVLMMVIPMMVALPMFTGGGMLRLRAMRGMRLPAGGRCVRRHRRMHVRYRLLRCGLVLRRCSGMVPPDLALVRGRRGVLLPIVPMRLRICLGPARSARMRCQRRVRRVLPRCMSAVEPLDMLLPHPVVPARRLLLLPALPVGLVPTLLLVALVLYLLPFGLTTLLILLRLPVVLGARLILLLALRCALPILLALVRLTATVLLPLTSCLIAVVAIVEPGWGALFAALPPLIVALRRRAPALLLGLPMGRLSRRCTLAIVTARGVAGAHAFQVRPPTIPVARRNPPPIAMPRGGIERSAPRIVSRRPLSLAPRIGTRQHPAPRTIDRDQIAARIGIAVIGAAYVIRGVGAGLVIIIAIAAIHRLGEGIVAVASLPCPGFDPAIGLKIIIGRRIADHLVERIGAVDIGVIVAPGSLPDRYRRRRRHSACGRRNPDRRGRRIGQRFRGRKRCQRVGFFRRSGRRERRRPVSGLRRMRIARRERQRRRDTAHHPRSVSDPVHRIRPP